MSNWMGGGEMSRNSWQKLVQFCWLCPKNSRTTTQIKQEGKIRYTPGSQGWLNKLICLVDKCSWCGVYVISCVIPAVLIRSVQRFKCTCLSQFANQNVKVHWAWRTLRDAGRWTRILVWMERKTQSTHLFSTSNPTNIYYLVLIVGGCLMALGGKAPQNDDRRWLKRLASIFSCVKGRSHNSVCAQQVLSNVFPSDLTHLFIQAVT